MTRIEKRGRRSESPDRDGVRSSWVVDGNGRTHRLRSLGHRRIGVVPQIRQVGTDAKKGARYIGVYATPSDAEAITAEAKRLGMSRGKFLIVCAMREIEHARRQISAHESDPLST